MFTRVLLGQSGATTGEIRGIVIDASHATVPGASVTATHGGTRLVYSAATDESGAYRIALLPPGTYALVAAKDGFNKVSREIEMTVGRFQVADFTLPVADVAETVEVTATAVETARTNVANTVTSSQLANLPLNGRDPFDLAKMTPGVQEANPNLSTLKQLGTSKLSFGGQNARANVVMIDGADNMDSASGSLRAAPSQEAVQEYQINSSGYQAEFGRASGGAINIVTRSGTDTWRGSLFLFHRNQSIQARNFFAADKPKFHRYQPGFTLGGPIRRERTFVFVSHEALIQREPVFVNILGNASILRPSPAQAPLFDFLKTVPAAMLQSAGLSPALPHLFDIQPDSPAPNARDTHALLAGLHGAKPFELTRNVASAKLDHRFSDKDSVVLRHIWSREQSSGNFVGGLEAYTRGSFHTINDDSFVAGYTRVAGPHTLNEFRFQYARRLFNIDSIDRFGPAVNIAGVARFGRDFNLDSDRTERRMQWSNNVSYWRGRHTIKFGADLNDIRFVTRTPIFMGGAFDFQNPGNAVPLGLALNRAGTIPVPAASPVANLDGVSRIGALLTLLGRGAQIPTLLAAPASQPLTSLQMFTLGLPVSYNQGFGNPIDAFSYNQVGFFVQDNIRATPRLNLNVGLRYDVDVHPQPMHRDFNNFGPRFGFSYDLSGDGRTVVRGGYGIFYQPVYQAVAFASRVLDGRNIVNVVRTLGDDLQGRPGAAALWQYALRQGAVGNRTITAEDLALFGLQPGRDSLVIQGVTPNIVNPYTHQGSFGLERQWGKNGSAEVNYHIVRGVKILRNNLANLRALGTRIVEANGRALNFGPIFQPVDPSIVANFLIGSEGSSIYHGMTARASQRIRKDWFLPEAEFLLSYTMGKAIDDATDINQSLAPQNPLNARDERSLSSFDVRHRLVASAIVDSPFTGALLGNWKTAFISTFRSGYPFNVLLGVDPGTGNINAIDTQRPAGAGRNTGLGPNFYSFDMRVARTIRFTERRNMEFIVEGFNLLNRTNFKSVNRTVGTFAFPEATFRVRGTAGRPSTQFLGFTEAFDPRQFQVALKIHF